MRITKKKFVETYKKYPAKKWIKFAFKYFSKETEEKDMRPSRTVNFILLFLFLTGFIGTIVSIPKQIIGIVTLIYGIILVLLVGFLLAAGWANNKRIKKIARELDLSLEKYNDYADKWKNELK